MRQQTLTHSNNKYWFVEADLLATVAEMHVDLGGALYFTLILNAPTILKMYFWRILNSVWPKIQ